MSHNDVIRRELGLDLIQADVAARAHSSSTRRDEAADGAGNRRQPPAPDREGSDRGTTSGGWVVVETVIPW